MTIINDVLSWMARPFTLRDETAVRYAAGSGENYTGKVVNPFTAMNLATVWRCVRLIAETIGTLPISLYRVDRGGKSMVADTDILHAILHESPNAEMSAVDFWEAQMASLLLWGNSYAAIVRTGGVIVALMPLRPDLMQLRRNQQGDIEYRYSAAGGMRVFPAEEMFHIKGFSLDGIVGLSPIAYARNSMGSAIALEESAATTFRNGIRVPGFLTMQPILRPDQREQFEKNIGAKFNGDLAAGRVPLMEGGATWQGMSINPEDAQMLESRAFSVEELCRWFGVPPFMVGHTEKSTSWGTGLEQQNIGFLTYVLRPYLKRIEQQVQRQLVPANLRATRFAKFNIEALLRADSAARAAFYASAAQNGWMSRDEIREKEDMAPFDTEGSKGLTVQSNLLPIDLLGKVPVQTSATDPAIEKEPAK